MTRRRPAALLAALLCLPALGACGSSSGRSADVSLRVTRDFGARPVGPQPAPRPAGTQTVLGLLERSDDVRGGRRGTPVQ
jgi:hypothetical protein